MCVLLEKDNLLSASEGIVNSQKIVHSEEIVHDFVKPKETNQTDEIEMEQQPRTRNGKKFQGMQNSMYHAIMIATGFVLTTVAILVGALVVISYFTKRWSRDLTRNSNKSSNGPKEIKKECKEIKPKEERVQCDLASEKEKQGSWTENNFAETETEQEDEELVEDQFLPSDSQLKSGLEFLFLKQQKRRWLARNSRNK